ncbi:MAG: DUF4139 domain-containing protein [Gammaproteobacteria bacterium]|nr:DUF4139 domain-containing protein [Gammaproteobacteria bacterium]
MNLFFRFGLLVSLLCSTVGAETRSTVSDQTDLFLTVYNAGRALVRDHRKLILSQPDQRIALMDVAEQIMPQTVSIDGLEVLEQNYDFDLLSPQSLINKNIGNRVRIARRSSTSGENLEWSEGKILSTQGGVILQMQDGSLEILNPDSRYHMVFDEIPANLRTTPTLSLLLSQPVTGTQQLELTYLTTGLSWQSDYVMQLNSDENSATLNSWITLNNQSGIAYHNAHLQLLAGDVNMQQPMRMEMMADAAMYQRKAISPVAEQALHGYHLYTIPQRTTIQNQQSKQIKLFASPAFAVSKKLLDQAYVDSHALNTQKSKPEQFLLFKNSAPELGLALPKGTLRVYARDDAGNSQFLGEDSIDHTAVNDALEIKLGRAFDLSVERSTTDFRQLSKKQTQLSRSIKINNGSKQAQTLILSEVMPTQSWQILQATQSHTRATPASADFTVMIPALTELTLSYDVVITYN